MLLAFISAITSATSVIVDKVLLTRERIPLGVLLTIGFIFIAGMSLIISPFFARVDWDTALFPNSLFLIFLMALLALSSNVLYYQSLKKQKVHNHELMMMLAPLMTIILAAVFFPEDLDLRIFGLALVASAALLFAKSEKEHFFLDKDSYNTFLAVVLISAETIVIKELLYSYTPIALYTVRAIILAIFFMAYYRPGYSKVTIKHWWMIAGSSLLGLILMITRYYALADLGVIYTMMILVLSPMIVYFFSWELLNEKIRPKVLVAAVIILTCVTWATLLSFN